MADQEAETKVAILIHEDTVVWLDEKLKVEYVFTSTQARKLGEVLIEKADQVDALLAAVKNGKH